MTTIFRLTDKRAGSEFNLNSLADGAYALAGGLQLFTRDQQAIWHTGIDGVARLLRLIHGNYGAAFQLALGGTWPQAHRRLAKLERWVNQANEANYETGRTWPVYLALKVEGMETESFHKVVYAVVDTQAALVNPVTTNTTNSVPVYGATLVLSLEPGTSQFPIEIGNALRNAATENWRDDGSLPLYWGKLGTPTFTRVYDRVLFGDSAVKITAGTVGDGISSTYTEVPVNHLATATAWISMDNSSSVWAFRIYSPGDGAVASQTGITYAWLQTNALETHIDRNGNAWYLVRCEQSPANLSLSTSLRVDFYETSNTGTDVVYFQGAVLKTVKFVTIPPSPDNPTGVDGSGWDYETADTKNTTAATDPVNKFEGEASWDVSFSTTTDTDGFFQTRLFMEDVRNETFVAQFWARMIEDGGASAIVELRDSANNVLDSREFNNGGGASDLSNVADEEMQGVDEQTWYAIRLSGTNTLAPGVRLVFRPTDTGTIDDFNFLFGSTYIYREDGFVADSVFVTGPDVWNRSDATTANPDRSGSLLLFNLPGDRDAVLDWEIEPYNYSGSSSKIVRCWALPISRRKGAPAEIEAELMTKNGVLWTVTADSSAQGGSMMRYAADGSPSSAYIYHRIPADRLADWSCAPYQIFVRAKASATASAAVWLEVSTNSGLTLDTFDPVSFPATGYHWLFLGTVNLNYSEGALSSGRGIPAVDLRIYAEQATPQTVDIDFLAARPALADRHAAWRFPEFSTYDRFSISGSDRAVVRRMTPVPTIGEPPWLLEPGPVAHRIFFTQTTTAEAHTLADKVTVRLAVWPRTSNLSGLA